MKAARLMRDVITRWEGGEMIDLEELRSIERAILKLEGRLEGVTVYGPQVNVEEVGTYTAGRLEATERHLEDLRRLVLLENEKGEV